MGAEEVARIEADVTAEREHIENPTTGRGVPWAPVPSASPSA
jgi:hypothetical protein